MSKLIERIVFFGTPDFAVPTLDALVDAGMKPMLVVSQPSRPVGRGRVVQAPPVARRAEELGIEVWQPQKVREVDFLEAFEALGAQVAVVVAFGQIFPPRLLAAPQWGCLNLHASLLPRHRGASPIQAALKAGDPVTGVGVMRMVEALDAGDVYGEREVNIELGETAGELSQRLSREGAELMVEVLGCLPTLTANPQSEEGLTYAPRIKKSDGFVNWKEPAESLENQWQAMTPWPGLSAVCRNERIRIHRVKTRFREHQGQPGEVLAVDEDALWIACGDGQLGIAELQRPGRKRTDAKDFTNGLRLLPGELFF